MKKDDKRNCAYVAKKKEKTTNFSLQDVKSKVKKAGYLLLATCYLLVVMACSLDNKQNSIPAGMGRVRINLNGVSARTILPASNALQLSDFVSYELIFLATTDGADDTFTQTLATGVSTFAEVDLVPGTYLLTVNAYKTGSLLAARGQIEVDVSADTDTPVSVFLRAVMDNAGSVGNFKWTIV